MLETGTQYRAGSSPAWRRPALQGWASGSLLEWDTHDMLALMCGLLSELQACPLHTDRPRGLVRSFPHLGFY